MKKVTSILASVVFMTLISLIISCGSGSTANNTHSTDNNTHSTDNTSSNKDKDGFAILNSKWEFVDAMHNSFVLDIKEMARDGESAKAEVIKNGNNIGHILIQVEQLLGYDGIDALEFKNCDNIRIAFPADFSKRYATRMAFICWDYENGFLYADRDALTCEDPDKRIQIKEK